MQKNKRFPRKLKKKLIKNYGRKIYQGLLSGNLIFSPFIHCLPTLSTIENIELSKKLINSRFSIHPINKF